jgi:glycosyltransferase involved in cell wall biosynthesis
VINHFKARKDYDVDVFTYTGHVLPDSEKLLIDLPGYDIIFCEWGLGNLKWFSHNKLPGQKLVTRIHSQEFSTPFLSETEWEDVDKIIFVAPHMMEKFIRLFPSCQSKCQVIYNLLDALSFNLEKDKDAQFNLGLLGILPKIKSPHLGLEILKELRKIDPRYRLFIKGKRPEELDWLWRNPAEQEYYLEFTKSIIRMGLQDAVIFDPHGNDVPEWFRKIGFILSTSEHEAFHMAIAEGMASGAIPIIRNWEGAKNLFPDRLIFDEPLQAVSLISNYSNSAKFNEEGKALKNYCSSHFSLDVLLPEYDNLLTRDIDRKKMRKALHKLHTQQQEAIQNENMVLKENMKLRSDLLTLHENNNKLKTDLVSMQDTNIKLKADLTSLQETNIKLKTDLTSLNETNNKLKTDFNSLQNSNNKLKTDFNSLQATNHKLQIDLTTNLETNNILKIDIQKLIAELELQRKSYKDLSTDLKDLRSELKETKRRFDEMQNSWSWKVGSALVRKPVGIIKSLGKK